MRRMNLDKDVYQYSGDFVFVHPVLFRYYFFFAPASLRANPSTFFPFLRALRVSASKPFHRPFLFSALSASLRANPSTVLSFSLRSPRLCEQTFHVLLFSLRSPRLCAQPFHRMRCLRTA